MENKVNQNQVADVASTEDLARLQSTEVNAAAICSVCSYTCARTAQNR